MDEDLLTYPIFENFPELLAFTTVKDTIPDMKAPGYSIGGNSKASAARVALANKLKLETDSLVFPKQEHTADVLEITSPDYNNVKAADALITSRKGICLCIQTADCVPVLFYDPVNQVIAAAHAGWRGTTRLIVRNVLEKMCSQHATKPANVLVAMGPAISAGVYEVGPEVVEAVRHTIPNAENSIIRKGSSRFHVDLHEANRQLLQSLGIVQENIEISGYCTYSHSHMFFSARREGITTGRMVTGIMLKR